MATVSLVWSESDRLRMAPLARAGTTSIGRDQDCTLAMSEPTVSRRQAQIDAEGGRFRLKNLSETNATKLNGQRVRDGAELSDGDRIIAGLVSLVFHDLRAGDRISGPICSHCDRENDGTAQFCWYCGTSLVNALSVARQRLRVEFRAVGDDQSTFDVHTGQALQLDRAAAPAVLHREELGPGAAAIEASEQGPMLHLPEEPLPVARNGHAAQAGPLADGDELVHAGGRLLILVRDAG